MKSESIRRILVVTVFLSFVLIQACHTEGEGGPEAPFLKSGTTVARPLGNTDVHTFKIALRAGDLIDVAVDQLGADVALVVLGPDGQKITETNDRPGPYGREYLRVEAPADGTHIVECRPASPAGSLGRYRLTVRNLLSAAEFRSRQVEVDPRGYEEAYANFELGPGHLVSIGPSDEFGHGGRLIYVDTKTRRFGKIYELADGSLYASPTMDDDLTIETAIRFRHDGNGVITGMEWTEDGGLRVIAPRVHQSRTEEVSFENGDVTLRGILILPEGPGPHPALVFVHGSGPSLRNQGSFLSFFQRYGLAVLSFDKRGAGQSTGDWKRSGMDDLASDILAGVGYLKTRSDIDAELIGLHGISQAGWVGSLAASRSPDVKFLIINTGSGVSVADNMAHELEGALRNARLPEDQILEAREFQRTLLHLASDGTPWDRISGWIDGAKGKPWFSWIRLAAMPEDNLNWAWLRMNGNCDSAEALKKVRCPVLWFLGDRDWNVPSAESQARIEAALKEGGNRNFKVLHLSPATHVLFESDTGFFDDVFTKPVKFVAGYWDTMDTWIRETLGLPRSRTTLD